MLVPMIVQSLLIPRILGVSNYGIVVGMLAPINLMSGLAEPLFASLFLRYREDVNQEAASNLVRGLFVGAACLPVALAGAVAFANQHTLTYLLSGLDLALVGTITLLFFVNAVLLGTTLASLGGKRLAACYLGQAFSTVCSIPIAIYLGVTGVLVLYVVNLATMTIILLAAGPAPRELIARGLSSARTGAMRFPLVSTARVFLAAVAPRSVILLLTIVTVLFCAAYMSADDLAMYRMSITLLTAILYLTPISQPVLLEFFSRSDFDDHSGIGSIKKLLFLLFSIGIAFGSIFSIFKDQVFSFIFGEAIDVPFSLNLIFFSAPFFIIIPSLSTILLAMRRDWSLIKLLLTAIFVFVIVFTMVDVYAAFLVSCIAFVAYAAIAMRRGGGRRDQLQVRDI